MRSSSSRASVRLVTRLNSLERAQRRKAHCRRRAICSASGRDDTKLPSASCTNCGRAWCGQDQDRIGGRPQEHVEVDETWVGGRARGEGRGINHKSSVADDGEIRNRKPGTAQDKRKDGRYAGRVRLAIVADRSADSLVRLCRERRNAWLADRHRRLERLMPACASGATTAMQLPNAATPKWPNSSCRCSTASSPI